MKRIIYTLLILTLTNVVFAQVDEILPKQKDVKVVVGAIGSTVDVTALGGASYIIPIQVPEGICGMQPNLAIDYNSQSRNGLLGWGWNLTGGSVITRVGHTLYHDNETKGVDFNDDRFALDGQRLMLVSNSVYGANGAEYRTELDGMTKIVSYTNDEYYGPSCFKVWLPNGNIAYYGYTENTRIELQQQTDVCMWMLDSIVDRNGNYVAYRYIKENSACRLQRILYTGNVQTHLGPNFSIDLEYSNRFDNEIAFIGNNVLRQEKILNSIKVYDNTALKWVLWQYDFQYDQNIGLDTPGIYNRLKSINFTCDGKKFNPTVVNWGTDNQIFTNTSILVDGHSPCDSLGISKLNGVKFTGDFNGDGYTDVIGMGSPRETRKLHVFLNDGVPDGTNVGFSDYVCFDRDQYLDWIYVGDFDGDGLDDFMCVSREPGTLFDHIVLKPFITRKNGDGSIRFDECDPLNDGGFLIGLQKELTLVSGDFLGNKKTSLFFQTHRDSKRRHIYIYYNGDYSNNCPFDYHNTSDLNAACIRAADFDGDGITELWYYSADENDWYGKIVKLTSDYRFVDVNNMVLARNDKVFIGDFNGDGNADFLSFIGNDQIWKINMWKQDESHWQSYNITNLMPIGDPGDHGFSIIGSSDSQYKAVEVADFNGDGKTDIAAIKEQSVIYDSLIILYAPFSSNGCAYKQKFHLHNTDIQHWIQKNICVGNFLGRENVAMFSRRELFSINPMTNRYVANNITDGMGNTVSFSYKYLMPNTKNPLESNYYKITHNYQNLGGSNCYVIALPMKGVARMSKYNVYVTSIRPESITYKYSDAIIHNKGRGFLGFERMQLTQYQPEGPKTIHKRHFSMNPTGNHRSLLLDYDSCFIIQRNSDDHILASVDNYYYDNKTNSNNNLIYMPLVNRKVSDQFDIYNNGLFLNRSIVRNFYDVATNYQNTVHCILTIQGTGLSALETNVDNAEYRAVTENTFQTENYEQWIVNRPYSTKSTAINGDDPNHLVSAIVTFNYNDNNPYLVTRQTTYPSGVIDPNDPLATFTEYQYDVVGNTDFTISGDLAGNLPMASIDFVYYPGKRLLKEQTNQAGYTTHFTYDQTFRYCNASTDYNGLTTYFSEDPMGVNKQTIYPDGTITRISTDWVQTNDDLKPINATYIQRFQKSGEAESKTYYDATGRELRKVSYGFSGEPICVDTKYDYFGLVTSVSEPFFFVDMGNELRTTFKYDNFNRNYKTISPDGTSVETEIDGFITTTTHYPAQSSNLSEQVTSTTVNAAGWTVEIVDAYGTAVNYEYYPDGLLKWTQIGNDTTTRVSIEYDNARNRILLTDPDYGTVTSVYNAYGQLVTNTDSKGNVTEYFYDDLGRDTLRVETDAVTNLTDSTLWTYDDSGNDRLDYITRNNQRIHYLYDALGRLQTISEKRPGSLEMTTGYVYDEFSRIRKVTYPTGYTIRKVYNEYGYLKKITSNDYTPLWETTDINEFGQVVEYKLGDDIINTREFDDAHRLQLSVSEVDEEIIQSFSYTYDDFGNLAVRKDNKRNMEEHFQYDDLNRLTTITLNNVQSQMVYDDYGRIISKQADGQTVFSGAQYQTYGQGGSLKPHAISNATMPFDPFPTQTQSVTYTTFDKVKTITQGNREQAYQYGYDHQRIAMKEKVDNQIVATKEYYSNCEIVNKGYSVPCTYLSGPLGTFAVVKSLTHNDEVSFIFKDHLGSWTAITDYDGDIQQELSFDAWGNLRNPATWSGTFVGTPLYDRGFTGHEHLYSFGLINMNGRMYDPIMSSFLSVDNFVQQPDNSQNFNRYTYCLNNPLKYVDPEGEDFIAAAIIIGGIIYGAYNGGALANGGNCNITDWNWDNMGTYLGIIGGGIVGGLSSWGGFAIAEAGFSFCNSVSLAASSLSYSIGMYGLGQGVGFDYDITMNLGTCSISFSPNSGSFSYGYLFKKGNSVMENIGYGLGALTNIKDAYQFASWDVLTKPQRFNRVQRWAERKYKMKNLTYVPDYKDTGTYSVQNDEIILSDLALCENYGWAKSTYMHEYDHKTRMLPQKAYLGKLSHLSQVEGDAEATERLAKLYAMYDSYAYEYELQNALHNNLSLDQFQRVFNHYELYSNKVGIPVKPYTYSAWQRLLNFLLH